MNFRALVAIFVGVQVAACAGYLPGRQAQWDEKLNEMCRKDGGVQIFDKVRLSQADARKLGSVDGKISVPLKELAHPEAPLFSVQTRTHLGAEGNVSIGRIESSITRRQDGTVVARWVAYSRSGGEIPIGLSDGTTRFCPELSKITADLQPLFVLDTQAQ
jgi:hypothetical protein